MKKLIFGFVVISFLFVLTGCPGSKFKYSEAWFPETAVNFTDVNSKYDDYNSALPEVHFGKKLIFSSSRSSLGDNFDIYDGNFYAVWYMETGTLQITDETNEWIEDSFHSSKLLAAVDKAGNQFAPYAIGFDTMISQQHSRIDFLAYSTNSGSYCFHSEFVYYISPDDSTVFEVVGPDTIAFLGDAKQQQYISFYSPGILTLDDWQLIPVNFTEMYFDQTGENGKSDIYKIDIPDTLTFLDFLSSDNNYEKIKVEVLNSGYNDRCPFVNGQFMVFASDRPGGFGGYDLYYSKFENGVWLEPVNFGDEINSEYDEFRPVVVQVFQFENDLMIFSSNRPGGAGGYDLYYVGIEKITPKPLLE